MSMQGVVAIGHLVFEGRPGNMTFNVNVWIRAHFSALCIVG